MRSLAAVRDIVFMVILESGHVLDFSGKQTSQESKIIKSYNASTIVSI